MRKKCVKNKLVFLFSGKKDPFVRRFLSIYNSTRCYAVIPHNRPHLWFCCPLSADPNRISLNCFSVLDAFFSTPGESHVTYLWSRKLFPYGVWKWTKLWLQIKTYFFFFSFFNLWDWLSFICTVHFSNLPWSMVI